MTTATEPKSYTRSDLETMYGQVWTTSEVLRDFEVISFAAPWAVAVRKSDGNRGVLTFQHMPRFYFDFKCD